ncbi:hypothetical protein MMC12_006913 [Toensbergia leucococca]|nr:hypothetical protein [Toensbergia leucococca]
MENKAVALKEEGNKRFSEGDFEGAQAFYTMAIQKDPKNTSLFTNRAFARIKLRSWEGCLEDCIKAIELQRNNLKGYYYLAQAQLALHHPNEALSSALMAYDICINSNDSSTTKVSDLVLQAKKEKWEVRERERLRRRSHLLRELEDGLAATAVLEAEEVEKRVRGGQLSASGGQEEKAEIQTSMQKKTQELQNIFAITDPEHMQRREVPDYMIDSISFSIMHDPVITKTGQSYDRSTIMEHFRRSETDPLTREPLRLEELRPNLALKQACQEFLEQNGWAVDW